MLAITKILHECHPDADRSTLAKALLVYRRVKRYGITWLHTTSFWL